MACTLKSEAISPNQAEKYLALSAGNRVIRKDFVHSLVVAMRMNDWDPDASEIVFDTSGALIDGHHRLHAVIGYGKPVTMSVKRGVSKSARGVIDTGRGRSIAHLIGMFRTDTTHISQRKTALSSCVSLLAGVDVVKFRTLDTFEQWMRPFKAGIEAAVEISRVGARDSVARGLQLGPVSGAFAFAHLTSPVEVEAFMCRVRDGEGLKKDEPAYLLRSVITSSSLKNKSGKAPRAALLRRVLNAIHAEITETPYKPLVNDKGLNYFRAAYTGTAVEKLVMLWGNGQNGLEERGGAPE